MTHNRQPCDWSRPDFALLQGGASGAFLFPSRDGQLVVKTLTAEETISDTPPTPHHPSPPVFSAPHPSAPLSSCIQAAALLQLAPAFAAHFARHPDSLINRFLGQFKMYLYGR